MATISKYSVAGDSTSPQLVLTVTETATSTTNNTSTVSWSFVIKRPYNISSSAAKSYSVTINGTKVKSGTTTIGGSGNKTIASGTQTIKHNDDGTKTISCGFSMGVNITWGGVYAGTVSASGNVKLTTLQRYATVTQSLTARTETSLTVKWSANATIDYIWYSSNNGSSWTGINVTDGTSGSYNISGLTANTTYKVKTRVRRKDNQLTTDSTAGSFATYAYPYANSMPSFTIGNTLTIGIFNPLGRSVTVNILGADNSQISNDTTTGTSITGYAGSVVVNRLYNSIPNAKSGTYKVKVTYGSQVTTKTGGTYTINTNIAKPTIGAVSYKSISTTINNLLGTDQSIVQNISKVQYKATDLSGYNGATIASCTVAVNGETLNLSNIATTNDYNNAGREAEINSATNVTALFTVTDSRGQSITKSLTVTMLEHYPPTAVINLQRKNNYYSETDLTANADYASLNGKNNVVIFYRYKTVDTADYPEEWDAVENGATATFTADNTKEWDVQILITDLVGGTTTYNLTLSIGLPIVFFDRRLRAIGFNCFPSTVEGFDIKGMGNNYKINAMEMINNVYEFLVYQAGDMEEIGGSGNSTYLTGVVTGTRKGIYFSFTTPKNMCGLTPIIQELKINVRCDGVYLLNSTATSKGSAVSGGIEVVDSTTFTTQVIKVTDNTITCIVKRADGEEFAQALNNSELSVALEYCAMFFGASEV